MTIAGVISAIIVGLVLGVLGRMVAPGKQRIPLWLTILVGIVAAFAGTAVARGVGVDNTAGIDWLEVLIQVIIAAIGVSALSGVWGSNRRKLQRKD